jgi:hypothetical protein
MAVAHAVPQAPQLALSFCTFTQASEAPAPHEVRPAGHTHVPAEQKRPAGHTRGVVVVSQPPQLFESVCRLKQPAAPHEVCPAGHAHAVVPAAVRHVWPGLQRRPQAPQLLKSDARFTHPTPAQAVCPGGHEHRPATHD